MAIDDPLDFTPLFTTSTIQTKSETVNLIITSLLTVLILANLGSVVSKIVYFTRRRTFDYNSWLRAFIFANSDDPLRIVSWGLGKYDYRDPKWEREKNHLRRSRLVLPLLARAVILLASIGSVALSIPGEKRLYACSRHDYALTVNPADASPRGRFGLDISNCFNIPLTTELGSLRSSATYCYHPRYQPFSFDPEAGTIEPTALLVAKSSDGFLYAYVAHRDELHGLHMYVEWKDLTTEGVTYVSSTDLVDLQKLMEVAIAAVTSINPSCTEVTEREYLSDNNLESVGTILDNCALGGSRNATQEASIRMEPYLRNALGWKPTAGNSRRIKVDSIDKVITADYSCPIRVIVTRPIANIVPLTIALVLWCLVNIIVTYLVNKRGHNILDASFHLIKEALGHDCTSNPLEENVSRDEVSTLNLNKWVCGSSGGGGHFGFLGREGDHPVDEFDHHIVVDGCARARTEVEKMTSLAGHPQRQRNNQLGASGCAVQAFRPEENPMRPSIPTSGAHHNGALATPFDSAPNPAVPAQQGSSALPHPSVGMPPPAYQYRPAGHQYPPGPYGGGYQPGRQ